MRLPEMIHMAGVWAITITLGAGCVLTASMLYFTLA
jgi:hypothetical protein